MKLDSGLRRNDGEIGSNAAKPNNSRLCSLCSLWLNAFSSSSPSPEPRAPSPAAESGFTLIELIITIVVLGIAVTGIMLAYTNIIVKSADPLLRVQSAAIAQAYLDEISLRPVNDPGGVTNETNRANFDDIGDYNGLSEPPTDQNDNPINNLGGYTVDVTTTTGGVPVNGVSMTQIQVVVTDPSGSALTLVGYRADY